MADMRGEFKVDRPDSSGSALFGGVVLAAALIAILAWGYSTDWWAGPQTTQTAQVSVNPPPVGPTTVPGLAPPADPATPPPSGNVANPPGNAAAQASNPAGGNPG